MLTYAIRCPEVSPVAIAKLDPQDFNSDTEANFQVIWVAALRFIEAYSKLPDRTYMLDMCSAVMMKQGVTHPQLIQSMVDLVNEIYAFEGPWNPGYGRQLLQAFFNRQFMSSLQSIGSTQTGDMSKAYEMVRQQFDRYDVSVSPEIDPFDLAANRPAADHRMPTGVTMVDMLLGGGIRPTECYGILGPSGGGKTLLALQLAASLAGRKRRVLYYTYEQPATELQPRLLSCAAKIPRSKIDNKAWSDMDDPTRNAIAEVAKYCKSHLSLIDRSSAGDNAVEIGARIQRDVGRGQKPDLVIIDWIWILAMRYAATKRLKGGDERRALLDLIDQFKGMASEHGTSILLLNQLSTEAAKKSAGTKPQWFNSAEAGNFAWLLAYCFAIGTADANGYCYLVGSKARGTRKQDTIMRLNGELNRFDSTDTTYTYDPRRKGFVDKTKLNSMSDQAPPPDEGPTGAEIKETDQDLYDASGGTF
jgi:RecA/RadA recombinase